MQVYLSKTNFYMKEKRIKDLRVDPDLLFNNEQNL